jgi:RND family efflux transporter MFP subunit
MVSPAPQEQGAWADLASVTGPDEFYAAWLALQCSMIRGVVHGVLVLGNPDAGPFAPVAFWPAGEPPSALLAEVAERSLRERRAAIQVDVPRSAVTCPVVVDGALHGVVAIESMQVSEAELQAIVRALRWGCYGVEANLRSQQSGQEQKTRERLMASLDLVASALAEEGFERAAQALATDLAIRLDCDRVSIGFVRDDHSRVVAVSHSAEFGERMNLIRAIGMAMDEALDQKSIVLLNREGGEVLVTRDHMSLARLYGSANVLTVPFTVSGPAEGEPSKGAFTFERPDDSPFNADIVELCQAVVALCSRVLEAKRLNDRLLPARIKDAWRSEMVKFTGPLHFGRKIAVMLTLGVILFFSVATGQYRVGATSSLEGASRRVLVAPFDGYIATSLHRAGETVATGTVLAAMDDRDLRLEYFKWASQRAQYSKQYQEAMAQHDRAQASIVQAQVDQAEAQMNLLAEQLGRTQIAAPFDGLIVSGDLNQTLGASVKRGQVLFEVAPLNSYRVVLEVDESEIAALAIGQKGSLLLSSLPGETFPVTVSHITPVTQSREGRTYFRVEALLDHTSDRLRPGMDGVAKIDVGNRKLIWIGTHKLLDWLRLTLWSWV